jgi:RNA polymerase sigma-70 factor (ECF subfamily)
MQQAVSRHGQSWQRAFEALPTGERRHNWTVVNGKRDVNNSDVGEAHALASHVAAVAAFRDSLAFERLFRHFAPRVKAYLMRVGADAATAEEVMQETMVALWRKAGQFDPAKSSVSTWVFTIARNLRIDAYRRERHPEIDPHDPALVPDEHPDVALESFQNIERVRGAMAALSEAEQVVLRLAYFEDKPQSAIAQQLGIPLGTVKSRVRLAFGKLRAALSDSVGEAK